VPTSGGLERRGAHSNLHGSTAEDMLSMWRQRGSGGIRVRNPHAGPIGGLAPCVGERLRQPLAAPVRGIAPGAPGGDRPCAPWRRARSCRRVRLAMQLIPRALVVGGFIPPAPPGQQQVTADRLNRIWSEVGPPHGFTQLQMTPDQSGAHFLTNSPDDGVTITPPVVQVRAKITTTAQQTADNAASIFGVILRHLTVDQFFNLGVRLIYSAPLPDNDARSFVLRRVLSRDEDDLADLVSGSTDPWGGVKYVIPLADRQYTLSIEPLQLDQMRSIYIDLDAQFPGEANVDSIVARVKDAQDYITGPVGRYLDQLAELQ
jgi:hypothetical protein